MGGSSRKAQAPPTPTPTQTTPTTTTIMGGSSSKAQAPPTPTPTQTTPTTTTSNSLFFGAPSAPPYVPSPSAYPSVPPPSAYPQVPIPETYPTYIPPVEPAVVAANPTAFHDINNYLITNVNDRDFGFENDMKAMMMHVDRFGMKGCAKYISKKGCDSKYCYRFHVCQFWVRDCCKKANDCAFDHHLDSDHNRPLVRLLVGTRGRRYRYQEIPVRELVRKCFFINKDTKNIENVSNNICMDYILNQCKINPCDSNHIHSLYSWEFIINEKWVKFPAKQNDMIEEDFCNPHNTSFTLLPHKETGRRSNMASAKNRIFETDVMEINFEKMSLTCDSLFSRVRRLTTPSDVGHFKSVATRWLWFWEDDNGNWNYYVNAIVGNYMRVPFSDYIEIQFLKKEKEFSFNKNRTECDYIIDFGTMVQRYKGNQVSRKIRRRPLRPTENEKHIGAITIFSLWRNVTTNDTSLRKKVLLNSMEFKFINSMMEASISVRDVTIERIENLHLWHAYQLKKSQMLKFKGGDVKSLNEQYLFHGTHESVIDKICEGNLDWRLYGTSVGNVYGKGTYFANSAEVSLSYTRPDAKGYRYMFLAAVLVGAASVGDSTVTFPPVDPKTKRRYDSTVNNSISPQIFVKYNLDEYCPLYLVKFQA